MGIMEGIIEQERTRDESFDSDGEDFQPRFNGVGSREGLFDFGIDA